MKKIKENIVKITTLSIFALFMLTPLLNEVVGILPKNAPHGMPGSPPTPPLTLKGIKNRTFQKRMEQRAEKSSGLWKPMLLLSNEIYRTLFLQISAFDNRSVLLGRSGYLFQPAHLAAFNRNLKYKEKQVEKSLQQLKKLQDGLQKKGKNLLFLITPNLITLYPEIVPARYRQTNLEDKPDLYPLVIQKLDQLGIQYVDTVALLKGVKQSYEFKLFSPSASHWNDVASCLALQNINQKLKSMGGAYFREFSCEKWHYEYPPRGKDTDLVEVANLLFPTRFYIPTPYVDVSYLEGEPKKKPSVLLVGSSYLFALEEHLNTWKLAEKTTLYFYFKQVRTNEKRHFNLLRTGGIDWKALFEQDVILINANVSSPTTAGYGFIKEAYKQFKALNPQE